MNSRLCLNEMEHILSNLKKQGKLPSELEDFLGKAQSFVERNKYSIEFRESKIKDIIAKVFLKSTKE